MPVFQIQNAALALALCLGLVAIPVVASDAPTDSAGPAIAELKTAAMKEGSLILVGYVPGKYVSRSNRDKNKALLAKITIRNGVIREVEKLTPASARQVASDELHVLQLRRSPRSDYDVIYPGLVDLHNHTKQNNLPLWGEALGQFENRFEWRAWSNYKKAVSGNMNPWIGFGKPVTCAAFRWSELQALVLGTTYLQGPSTCVENFAINRVEDKDAFRTEPGVTPKAAIQAPTDIVIPGDMTFVWNHIRPKMMEMTGTGDYDAAIRAGATYESAFRALIGDYCPRLVEKHPLEDVNGTEELKILSDKAKLEDLCDADKYPDRFIRYAYWVHKTIAGKKKYLQDPDHSAVIVHLAEGSRNDEYNQLEFHILRVLGLDMPDVNFVHGVGINAEGYRHMASRNMGLVWSPFSNLLLYSETADIRAARDAGVTIALGSDWTPTGSKSVLEELKIAREYIVEARMKSFFDDHDLYQMVTENAARLMNHYESDPGDGRHGIGAIAPDAMASLTVLSRNETNPYTNLVLADSKDVNLVLIDGVPVYGNIGYLTRDGMRSETEIEKLPAYYESLNELKPGDAPMAPSLRMSSAVSDDFLVTLATAPVMDELVPVDRCGFPEQKGLVHQSSGNSDIVAFASESGLNLDRASDLQKLLGVSLMTQSRNLTDSSNGDPAFAVTYFPDLYSCNDPAYTKRFRDFVSKEWPVNAREKAARREALGLGRDLDGNYEDSEYVSGF